MDEARTKEHIEKLNKKLDAYEAILAKHKYLAGDVSARVCERPLSTLTAVVLATHSS
jgi:glutathionyl-hydroquinone reductase